MTIVAEYENPIVDILLADQREPAWVIPKMIPEGTLVCLAGESGAGKSFLAYTIAIAVASGFSALSGIVPAGKPQSVLYFDNENSLVDRNAYMSRAWRGLADATGNPPDIGVLYDHFIPVHFYLGGANWEEVAAAFVERFRPALIVFDTAISCFPTDSENDNAEAGKHMAAIRRLMKICGSAVIVLKHAKVVSEKGGKRSIRGATIWKSLADQTMFQVKAQGRPRKLGGLSLTRLVPEKGRAFALEQTIYITPSYTDKGKTGLLLEASLKPDKDHKRKLDEEGEDDE